MRGQAGDAVQQALREGLSQLLLHLLAFCCDGAEDGGGGALVAEQAGPPVEVARRGVRVGWRCRRGREVWRREDEDSWTLQHLF